MLSTIDRLRLLGGIRSHFRRGKAYDEAALSHWASGFVFRQSFVSGLLAQHANINDHFKNNT